MGVEGPAAGVASLPDAALTLSSGDCAAVGGLRAAPPAPFLEPGVVDGPASLAQVVHDALADADGGRYADESRGG
jgi:hypothetical protein